MTDNGYDLFSQMHESEGMAVINRLHTRSFSVNIFLGNYRELNEALKLVENTDVALKLMTEENREADNQVHREVHRLFHNFLAGAKTLVDHTRAWVSQHYPNTKVSKLYNKKVKSEFETDELSKFINDLRNYMLHKGLPSTERFLRVHAEQGIESGINLQKERLLEWDKWTKPAKCFLTKQEENFSFSKIVEDYHDKILDFHNWLDNIVKNYHKADISELQKMQKEYEEKYGT
ncbi:hypothetical protein [Terasakiella sp. SH-1]|uniref:hypothetical protein n=1 Tax=Terasakiella sp. SH-1 TaxID=2560057 RepID=UPI00107344A1|nr:hypothetical protein [Terasakiella sp. SH-1]